MTKIHIVYSVSATGTLNYVLKQLQREEEILTYQDDISIGPLYHIANKENQKKRLLYFQELENGHDDYKMEDTIASFYNQDWSSYDKIILWCGNNVAERTLLCLMCSLLPKERLYIASNEFMETGLSYASQDPEYYEQLLDKEVPLNDALYQKAILNWKKIVSSKATVRIFKEDEVLNVGADYYDPLILECAKQKPRSTGYLVGMVLFSCQQIVSDTYIFNRAKKLGYK